MNTAIIIGTVLCIILILAILGATGELLYFLWKIFGFFMDILIHGFLFLCGIGIIGCIGYFIYLKSGL
jgi:hypothetical protein